MKDTFVRILKYLRPHIAEIILSILLSIGYVISVLSIPVYVGRAIDMMVEGSFDPNSIVPIIIYLSCFTLSAVVCQYIMGRLNNRITFKVVEKMRQQAYLKIQRIPVKYFDRKGTGDIVSRIINDTTSFSNGLLLGFSQLFTGVCTVIITIIMMMRIHLITAVAVIVLTPLSIIVSRFIALRSSNMFRKRAEMTGEQMSFLEEMITSQKTVKAFSHEEENIKEYDKINKDLEDVTLKAVFYSSLVNPSTRFVNNIVYAVVTLVGAMTVIGGGLTIGGFSIFLSYATQYNKPFNEISGVIAEFQNSLACAKRIMDFLDTDEMEPDDGKTELKSPIDGRIDIEHLYFSYSHSIPLIKDLNLEIEKGKKVAIVGPTGAGKTTIINLLMKFFDPDSGVIKVEGQDLQQLSTSSVRNNYGMILQDTWIKTATVKENISIGLENITDEQIRQAAILSHADSFIQKLPQGYDTVITDNESLSQGQKQLLCIARLMLRHPSVLFLDEATSSIDTRTEMKIQDAFALLMEGRTSLIVAHRLSTITNADIILCVDKGDIVEKGSHKELMEKKGLYWSIYNSQFGMIASSE